MCALVVAFVHPFAHAMTTGVVVEISDGDTLSMMVNGSEHHIRLASVQAPRITQPFGPESRRSLNELVFGKTVSMVPVGRDENGRTVARVRLDLIDASLEQARRGMAWSFARYGKDAEIRAAAEEARLARVGLWQDAHPVAPWVYGLSAQSHESGPAPQQSTGKGTTRSAKSRAPVSGRQAGTRQSQVDAFLNTVPSAMATSSGAFPGTSSMSGDAGHAVRTSPDGRSR
jgi:endonuclease YncB( thermonuclease family)